MNSLQVLSTIALSVISFSLSAQETSLAGHAKFIAAYPLELGSSKTTSIIFRAAISSVDRGSGDILAQKVKGSENILQLKAATEGFEPTSLTVLTRDGRIYAFDLTYSPCPEQTNIIMNQDTLHTDNITAGLQAPVVIFSKANFNQEALKQAIGFVREDRGSNVHLRARNQKASMQISGVYAGGDMLLLRVDLENSSYIDFEAEPVRFLIKDQQKYKRMSTQEMEIETLQMDGNISMIKGQQKETVIVALPRFTIPDKKELIIQLMEHNGGRHLQLKVSNRILVKAKPVSF